MRLPLGEANDLYADGLAELCRRSSALKLTEAAKTWVSTGVYKQWDVRGDSCRMNSRIMDRIVAALLDRKSDYLDGAAALLSAWRTV